MDGSGAPDGGLSGLPDSWRERIVVGDSPPSYPCRLPDWQPLAVPCWHWRYSDGRVLVGNRKKTARRAVYELLRGPIPARLFMLPLCNSENCVNPAHFRVAPMPAPRNGFRALRRDLRVVVEPPSHEERYEDDLEPEAPAWMNVMVIAFALAVVGLVALCVVQRLGYLDGLPLSWLFNP